MGQEKLRQWKKFSAALWCLFLSLSLALVLGCSSSDDDVFLERTVEVEAGDATLTCADKGDIVACRGIPYAEPPVGDLRFAPPAPRLLEGNIRATSFGSACVQDDGSGSEDCLFLNVFFPKDTELGDNLPVMVWIHGGALIQGASSVPGYDLPALVKEGVIVVTINYRLNAFGFLPHPALEDPTGNFGLKDQVAALEWVKDYIEDFGGNPDNVTIFGESAGGHSVLSLMVSSRKDSGLFHKAIVQSGSYSPEQTALGAGYYILGSFFGDLNGYPDVVPGFPPTGAGPCSGTNEEIRACLRNLTTDEVMDIQLAAPTWVWISPVYAAGTFLPKNIQTALTDGDVANVPVMIGSNRHEGTLFTALFMADYNSFASLEDLENGVVTLLVADPRPYSRYVVAEKYTDEAAAIYGDNVNKYRNAHSMIFTDATFSCNALAHAGALAAAGRPTYSYWFTDADAPINPTYSMLGFLSGMFDFGEWGVGAVHSFEIQYIFGTVQTHPDVTPAQRNLSDRMIAYWTNFAKEGEPGDEWTAYDGTNIRDLNPAGDSDATAVDFATAHYCACWADPEACTWVD